MNKYMFIVIIGILAALQLNAENFDLEKNLVFHFNFKDAAGKKELKDTTGKFSCISKDNDFVIQRDALRVAPVAKIYIPSENLPDISEKLTVSAWILKRATPDATPILMKGEYGEPIEFLFSVGWRYPVFCYKNQPKQHFWKGVYYLGDFGSRIYYGQKDFLVSENNLIESSGYWKNITATFDQGNVKIYVNGKLTAQTVAPKPEKLLRNDFPIYVGASRLEGEDLNFQTSDMLINDLRLYNRSLSADEAKAIFDTDKKNYTLTSLIPAGETHLNALPPCEDYPFDKNYDPEFKRTLNLTAKYEQKLVDGKITHEKITNATVKRINDVPSLFINDSQQFPLQLLPGFYKHADGKYKWRQGGECIKDFAAAGIDLVGLTGLDRIWIGDGEYDWDNLDSLLKLVISANPNAKLMPYLQIFNPPKWFVERYPEEFEKMYYGSDLRVSYNAPLGSRIWLKHSVKMLHDLVTHLESSPYGEYIYGYKVGGGESAEWYWPGGAIGGLALSGYSDATAGTFREWLRKKYADDIDKLRKSWNDQEVTFVNAKVPGVLARKQTENYFFRDPKIAAAVIDFRKYMSDMTLEHITATTKTVKEACNFKKAVLIYAGYQINSDTQKLANNGRLANEEIFSSPYIDMLTTPIGYRYRRGGQAGLNVNPFDSSAALHNKIIWRENDLRTHFCEKIESSRTATMEETINVVERGFGHALISNGGFWFYPFNNAWFHQDEVMESIERIQTAAKRSLDMDRRSAAEVAILFDEKSLLNLAYDCGNFMMELGSGTHQNAARMGAPFDMYMLSDIKNSKMPDYKMYIFLNAFQVDDTTYKAITHKVKKNNAVSVWCYAPGYISDKGFDIESSAKLSGIRLQETRSKQRGKLRITKNDHLITGFAGEFNDFNVGPVFSVADPEAKILGMFNGQPALAVKEFANWRSVYSLMPLTKELLMGLCDYAGVHVYSRSFDVFRASKGFIMIHSSKSGEKKILLPKKCDVGNLLYEGKKQIGTSEIIENLPKGETKIYYLETTKK